MSSSAPDALAEALRRYDLAVPDDRIERLDQYCQLLWDWNTKLNLTRHTDYDRFVSRDLVDCLQLSALLPGGERVLDVGSGGGVPGVVLALLRDDLQISMAESVGKKAGVLRDIIARLALHVPVYAERAEHLLEREQFDTLTARAVGPLWKMLKWFEPHWGAAGRLLAIKGPNWVAERGEARHRGFMRQLELRKVAEYPLLGTDSTSVILQIRPRTSAE